MQVQILKSQLYMPSKKINLLVQPDCIVFVGKGLYMEAQLVLILEASVLILWQKWGSCSYKLCSYKRESVFEIKKFWGYAVICYTDMLSIFEK